jgi:hypothetical protein
LPQGLLESFASNLLRGRLIIAGRNPLLQAPWIFFLEQLFKIPSPFNNFIRARENADESKRIYPWEWQLLQRLCHRDCGG